jgi:hypothetical protein
MEMKPNSLNAISETQNCKCSPFPARNVFIFGFVYCFLPDDEKALA